MQLLWRAILPAVAAAAGERKGAGEARKEGGEGENHSFPYVFVKDVAKTLCFSERCLKDVAKTLCFTERC